MFRRYISAALLGLTLLLAGAGGAMAHASLVSSAPPQDAVLADTPAVVDLTFNEAVGVLSVSLIGPGQYARDLTGAATGGTSLRVGLPDDAPRGTLALTWRVASEDGHPVAGTLIFSVGAVTGSSAPPVTDRLLAFAIWVNRLALYAGLFLGAGTLAFRLVAPLPPTARDIALGLGGIGAVAAILSVGLQGLDGLGLGLEGLTGARPWVTGWGTSLGASALCAALALATAPLTLLPHRRTGQIAAFATLGLIGLALARTGHASAAPPQVLTRPAVFVHAATIAFWTGALIPLAHLLRQGGRDAEAALARFSALIPYALAPLLAAGSVLAAVQLGWPGPGWIGPYGAILLGKLVAVAMLLALASYNRWRLTRPALAGEAQARWRLARSSRAEIVIVLVVLALVAGWRFTPPPRIVAATAPAIPAVAHLHSADLMGQLEITPGRAGPTEATLYLTDGEFVPIAPLSVVLEFVQEAAGIGPIVADAAPGNDGAWHAPNVVLPTGGTWTVTLKARVDRFELRSATGEIDLK